MVNNLKNSKTSATYDILFLGEEHHHLLDESILEKLTEIIGPGYKVKHIDLDKFRNGKPNDLMLFYPMIRESTVVFHQRPTAKKHVAEAIKLIGSLRSKYLASYIIGVFPLMWDECIYPLIETDPSEDRIRKIISSFFFGGIDEILISPNPHSKEIAELCKEYGIIFHEVTSI